MTPVTQGGGVYALARRLHISPDSLLDFSGNVNMFAQPLTEELIANTAYPYAHYPDNGADALVSAISGHEQIEPERILVGNGAAELVWLVMLGLAPGKVLFLGPVSGEYVRVCHACGIAYEVITPPEDQDFLPGPAEMQALWESDADLVILRTPNSPAGVTYPCVHNLLNMLRAPRVLIDNSYREFLYGSDEYQANSPQAYQAALRPGVSLLTLHSFSKFFCCPGIRLGYIMGDRTQIARIAARQASWSVSQFAQIMGQCFLARIEDYRETIAPLFAALEHMGRELRRLDHIRADRVIEGPGFICCGLGDRLSAEGVASALLSRRFVVRSCDLTPGMPPGYLNIQARPVQDVARLIAALEALPHTIVGSAMRRH